MLKYTSPNPGYYIAFWAWIKIILLIRLSIYLHSYHFFLAPKNKLRSIIKLTIRDWKCPSVYSHFVLVVPLRLLKKMIFIFINTVKSFSWNKKCSTYLLNTSSSIIYSKSWAIETNLIKKY